MSWTIHRAQSALRQRSIIIETVGLKGPRSRSVGAGGAGSASAHSNV